jgi:hypothetical protein
MAIQFHCEHCGRKIEAGDTAAGKWGKCPSCHNKVYIPLPEPEGDDLKLAPLDESDSVRQKKLMEETFNITKELLEEKTVPEGAEQPSYSEPQSAEELSDKELMNSIIMYLRLMADGDEEGAENNAQLAALCGPRSMKILDRIAVSDIPEPELADVPAQVLSGLIRDLRSRIKR